jgi:hypothetical protein
MRFEDFLATSLYMFISDINLLILKDIAVGIYFFVKEIQRKIAINGVTISKHLNIFYTFLYSWEIFGKKVSLVSLHKLTINE